MISRPTLFWRSRLAPVVILVAVMALLGVGMTMSRDGGSDVDTVAGDPSPRSSVSVDPAALSGRNAPAAPSAWWRRVHGRVSAPSSTAVAAPTASSVVTPGPPTVPSTIAVIPASAPGDTSGASATGVPAPQGPGATQSAGAATTSAATATTATTKPPTTMTTRPPASAAPPAGCANPWANLEGCGWAGPGNTGPRSANCPNGMTANGSSTTGRVTISVPNTVISCQRITGALVINAANVTVRDSIVSFDGGGGTGGGVIVIDDNASATIDHVEIDGLNHTHACVWYQGTSMTVDAINCHGTDDGVFTWARTTVSPTAGDNFTVRNSYFHGFTHEAANGHIDGFQTEGAANGVIAHNTFLMGPDANAAVSIWNGAKNSTNITVTGNLMTGGQFTVYAEDYHPSEGSPTGGNTVTNISFTNNAFSTHAAACVGYWGAWYSTANAYQGGPTDGWRRSGNYVVETGQSLDQGNLTCR